MLFVGSTPTTRTNSQRAGSTLSHSRHVRAVRARADFSPRATFVRRTFCEPLLDVRANLDGCCRKGSPCQRAIADTMPQLKQSAGLGEQSLPNWLRCSTAFGDLVERANQVGPAHLPPREQTPTVAAPPDPSPDTRQTRPATLWPPPGRGSDAPERLSPNSSPIPTARLCAALDWRHRCYPAPRWSHLHAPRPGLAQTLWPPRTGSATAAETSCRHLLIVPNATST